eukprot:TRINITY_DN3989_c0_g1_i2.p1 TRINITY_DN3989_c0_g1~~TRINITY_DN3989_c0_g1_i2.p1  ORF type:complete len:334 (+),score=93.47 TRINITY_DN3989_c0_g1_i2:62-1003(+)
MAEGVEVFLRAYDATRTRVRTAVDATQAEVADVGFAASAAAVQEEELRSATEGRDVAVARREELAWRLETLQLRNEELLKRKAEDLKKIQTLERLAGPCLQHIVYEHGRKPEIIGWTGRGHGAGVPVIMSKYRNRAVEGEVRQLDGEIEVMKAKIAKQREGWVEEVQGLRTAFATEHDASHEQLLALHARRQESQTLHAALLKQLVTSRTEAFEREENLLRSSAALKAELAEVNETHAKQRQWRASDMAAVLNSAKAETRSTTLSLAEERAEQAAREADVLKTAEEKRARYTSSVLVGPNTARSCMSALHLLL